MNLFKQVRTNYGQNTVKIIREWDKNGKKLARSRNHLVFNLRCKDEEVCPSSLKIKCPIKTKTAEDIVIKARKDLLRERIRITHNKVNHLEDSATILKDKVSSVLPQDLAKEVEDFVKRSSEREFKITKDRHQTKLAKLIDKKWSQSGENLDLSGSQMKRWVINLSKYKCTNSENSVLAKGLNFSVSPAKIPVEEFIVATEQAAKLLNEVEAEDLRQSIVGELKKAKPPPSNISVKERKALKSLAKNKDILILPADKGKATVVIDAQVYKDKVSEMLSDTKTYERLPKDPTDTYRRKLIALLKPLKEQGKLTKQQYDYLYPTSDSTPRLYGSPKIHKEGTPFRPIVDYTGSMGYPTSRFLADIVGPLVGENDHNVNNSKELAEELGELLVEEGYIFNSHDVIQLFTKTPIEDALEITRDRLKNDKTLKDRTKLDVEDIIDLLRFVLTTTYFLFDGVLYRQKFGAAMGSPVSPIIANLYLEDLESKAIESAPAEMKPKLWKRYVDDILDLIKKDKVKDMNDHLNTIDETGSTYEPESEQKIAFLDTLITRRDDGSVKLGVYRKPTHTDQYLNFGSHHHIQHKLGVVH